MMEQISIIPNTSNEFTQYSIPESENTNIIHHIIQRHKAIREKYPPRPFITSLEYVLLYRVSKNNRGNTSS